MSRYIVDVDEQQQIDTVRRILEAGLQNTDGGSVAILTTDEVQAAPSSSRPECYVELNVQRLDGGLARGNDRAASTVWLVQTRPVDQRGGSNARLTRARVTRALEGAQVAMQGRLSTPVQFETSDPILPDDGWFSGLDTWTYCL